MKSEKSKKLVLSIFLGSALIFAVILVYVAINVMNSMKGNDNPLAEFKCENKTYVITRKDNITINNFATSIKIKEASTGLVINWPVTSRENKTGAPLENLIHPVNKTRPIVLVETGEAPKFIIDLTREGENTDLSPHIDCIKAILPEVRRVLEKLELPYGIPQPSKTSDDTFLLWEAQSMW